MIKVYLNKTHLLHYCQRFLNSGRLLLPTIYRLSRFFFSSYNRYLGSLLHFLAIRPLSPYLLYQSERLVPPVHAFGKCPKMRHLNQLFNGIYSIRRQITHPRRTSLWWLHETLYSLWFTGHGAVGECSKAYLDPSLHGDSLEVAIGHETLPRIYWHHGNLLHRNFWRM